MALMNAGSGHSTLWTPVVNLGGPRPVERRGPATLSHRSVCGGIHGIAEQTGRLPPGVGVLQTFRGQRAEKTTQLTKQEWDRYHDNAQWSATCLILICRLLKLVLERACPV